MIVLIRNGMIYDGSGGAALRGDVGIKGDRIVYAGPIAAGDRQPRSSTPRASRSRRASSTCSAGRRNRLLVDGLGQSDLRQGVTLEVMGEGWSMGPLNDQMKKLAVERQGDFKYPIEWTTLGDYLSLLEKRGTSMNVASFVGATTVRQHELGEGDVDPTPEQLRSDARAGPAGDGGRRARRRLVADLPAGDLCRDRRAGRADDRSRPVRRQLHQPHALRRRSPRSRASTS